MEPKSHHELAKQLGERLRWVRLQRGLTQEQVGELAGYTGKYISEAERGLRDLPLSTLRDVIEQALHSTFEDVFRDLGASNGDAATADDSLPPDLHGVCRALARLSKEKRRAVVKVIYGLLELA